MTTINIEHLTVNAGPVGNPLSMILRAISFDPDTAKPTETTPPAQPRFVVSHDCATVTDTDTGLTWTKGNVGARVNYAEAEKACAELTTAGHSDWRLPTRTELESILDLTRSEPAIDPVFACDSAWYWTSTPYASSSGSVWLVSFDYGYVGNHHRGDKAFVRAVRGPSPAGQ